MIDFPPPYTDFLQFPAGVQGKFETLVDPTVAQVQKDLSFYNESWVPEPPNALVSLTQKLRGIKDEKHKLVQLLYRIDVSPSTLEQLLVDYQEDTAWKHLTALIWHREMRKVWLRRQFRDGNSSDLPPARSV